MAAIAVCVGVGGGRQAKASESYEKATNLKCKHCHKIDKDDFKAKKIEGWDAVKDMDVCGDECLTFLKKQPGFKPLTAADKKNRDVAETKKLALTLLRGKWKCKHQSAPQAKID